jgi:hypothetical protein
MDQLKILKATRDKFERLFNIIPFIVLAIAFITIPSTLANIARKAKSAEFSTLRNVYYICQNSANCFVILLLVYYASKSREKASNAVEQMIEVIHKRNINSLYTNGSQAVIDALKSYADFSFTGWYLFKMNRSLILTFLSAIISFSVLIIQLGSS